LPPDKQACIGIPEVRIMDIWKKNDWIIMGSSGFWEIMRYHSKGCIDKIKDVRFPEALNNAKKKNSKLPSTYDKKD
jgi:hypothetical protein